MLQQMTRKRAIITAVGTLVVGGVAQAAVLTWTGAGTPNNEWRTTAQNWDNGGATAWFNDGTRDADGAAGNGGFDIAEDIYVHDFLMDAGNYQHTKWSGGGAIYIGGDIQIGGFSTGSVQLNNARVEIAQDITNPGNRLGFEGNTTALDLNGYSLTLDLNASIFANTEGDGELILKGSGSEFGVNPWAMAFLGSGLTLTLDAGTVSETVDQTSDTLNILNSGALTENGTYTYAVNSLSVNGSGVAAGTYTNATIRESVAMGPRWSSPSPRR